MARLGKTKTFSLLKIGLLVVFMAATAFLPLLSQQAYAVGQITNRSLTLGSSASNAATSWTFKFDAGTAAVLESMSFQVCTTATGTCTNPNAWVNTSVSYTSLTYNGSSQSGWVTDTSTGPCSGAQYFCIKNASASNSANTNIVAVFNAHNPTTSNQTFYVRITTYTDVFVTSHDSGVVAASTANQIILTGYMPESLIFCAGGTVSTTAGVPDCSTATSGSVSFPDFSPASTSFTTSQMAASTNANSGYAITYSGATMTSGGHTITPASNGGGGATTSTVGISQFGLNLAVNATPAVGTAINPASSVASKLLANPTTNYATADNFYFTTSGDTIAESDYNGTYGVAGTLGPTDAQIYTVSYIVNVDGAQPVGTYTTTLTYICTATY